MLLKTTIGGNGSVYEAKDPGVRVKVRWEMKVRDN